MNKGCILGGGPAGLIAGYYFPEFPVLDEKPLGQLNLPFIPGPRLIQRTKNTEKFVRSVLDDAGLYGYKIKTVIAKVGYQDNGTADATPPPEFKKNYTKLTRDKSDFESSYLSEGKNEIEHLEIDDMGENSYKFLFKTLLKIIDEDRGQLKRQRVTQISPAGFIHAKEGEGPSMCYQYDTIINTLSLKLLTKEYYGMKGIWRGDELKDLDLTTLPKCFYQTNKGERSQFDYVYGYKDGWTRKTYFKEYMVYESVDPIVPPHPVINQFENLPIQIKNSLNLDKFDRVYMLGRFAQWNHKVKANEVIDRVVDWSSKYRKPYPEFE
jgi:hypothetical protein